MFYSDISINCPIKFKNAIKEPRQPFPNGEFYDFEGDRYCLHCYQVLYAPECQKCGEFVNGEVVKVMFLPISAQFCEISVLRTFILASKSA